MKRCRYLRRIRAAVHGTKAEKDEYMHIVETDVADFLADFADADEQTLEENLGTPEELSRAFLDAMGTAEIHRRLKKTKSMKRVILATVCILAALVVGMFAVGFAVVRINKSQPVYYSETDADPYTPHVVVRYE